MFRRGSYWLACACAPALAACSLLLGEGFTDPNVDPTSEAGTTPDSAPNGESDGSNPQLDGGLEADGSLPGSDGGDAGDDGGSGVCPVAQVSFCDTFERATPQGDWDSVFLNAGGSLVVGTPTVGSKRLESNITAVSGAAQLMKAFKFTPTKVHFELRLLVSALPQAGGIYIGGLTMENGVGAPSLLYLFVNETALYFVEQVADGGGYHASTVGFSTGVFHHVVVDVQFTGNTVVSVDGTTKVTKAAESFLVPKPMDFYLGGASIDGVGKGVGLLIDDFVFTAD